MGSQAVEDFRASLNRCLGQPSFLKDFYGLFIASSEAVREKFKNTELERQTRMLADSLYLMAVVAQSGKESVAWGELARLARRHGPSDLNIEDQSYDVWLECLLQAVRRTDPQFSPEIEAAWRTTLAPGLEYMRSKR